MAYDPRRPGGVYYCGYWRIRYRVDAISPDGEITETTLDPILSGGKPIPGQEAGRTVRHRTAWDPRRDKVVSQP